MFNFLNCGCFTNKPEVMIKSHIQLNSFLPTQVSSTDQGGGGGGSSGIDSINNTSSGPTSSQQNQSQLHNLHNEMSNYTLILEISALNTSIKPIYDFLYIVPEKTPLCFNYSSVNSRYKIGLDIGALNDSTATAKYNLQYLALNEIYKIYYVRRDKKDELQEVHTTQKFKFILRAKNHSQYHSRNSPKLRFSTIDGSNITPKSKESHNINSIINQHQYGIEIVQAFEGDPDFYRENFDFELKLLLQTPSTKQKYMNNGQDTQSNTTITTAPFQINNCNTINNGNNNKMINNCNAMNKNQNVVMQDKNKNNYNNNLNSGYDTSISNSLYYQTNNNNNNNEVTVIQNQQKQNQNISNIGSICTPLLNNSQQLISTNNQTPNATSFNIHHNHKNSKADETFIIDESKFNDYAMKMSHLLQQKIEFDDHIHNQQKYLLTQQKESDKQNKSKYNGRTLSYNTQEIPSNGLKQPQSAPKNTTYKSKILNKNKAFIYNSECSQNSFNNITPQSRSNVGSDYKFIQNDNGMTQSQTQINQKLLYKAFKDSKTDLSISSQNQHNHNNNKFIMQTPNKNQKTPNNIKFTTPNSCLQSKVSQNLQEYQLHNQGLNNQNQGSVTQLGKLLKTQQKQSFQSSNKSSVIYTPSQSAQKFNLRFENEVQKMMVEQKLKKSSQNLMDHDAFHNYENKENISTLNQISGRSIKEPLKNNINPSINLNEQKNQLEEDDDENTPVEQKLYTVEEANSPFETSINRFYTQKSSPSKYRVTQTEYNRIDETEEYSATQYTNSDIKKIKNYLKQFKQDEQYASSSASSHKQKQKTYEQYQLTPFNTDYNKMSLNKSSSLIAHQQMSRREKTIQYMIPVYEYKMEKLGFNFVYDADKKNVIISKQKSASKNNNNLDQCLQQSVFKIDERIKTDQLANYFEDICANIKYQTID